jgi:hypothetical protein
LSQQSVQVFNALRHRRDAMIKIAPARRGYFASRAELGSAPGEVEKCHDGIFQQIG